MRTELSSPRQILESEHYAEQRTIVGKEINQVVRPFLATGIRYAPARIADLARVCVVDYTWFKRPDKERLLIKGAKLHWRRTQRKKFPGWKRKESGKHKYLKLHSRIDT